MQQELSFWDAMWHVFNYMWLISNGMVAVRWRERAAPLFVC